jgi:tyrosyl-tRNA synthetase
MAESPEKREAQRTLARETTAMVHGADELGRAERASTVLFGGSLADASADEILMVFDDVPATELRADELAAYPANALVTHAGLAASKGEATRLIKQGGIYMNDRRVTDERSTVTVSDAIGGRVIVLRKGQRERRVVKIT